MPTLPSGLKVAKPLNPAVKTIELGLVESKSKSSERPPVTAEANPIAASGVCAL